MNWTGTVRWLNVAVGAWLLASAFLWSHIYVQFTNTWMVGLACAGMALLAMRVPQARYVNVLLALWLFASVWALPVGTTATFWNNILASVVMCFVALMPNAPGARGDSRREPLHVGTR